MKVIFYMEKHTRALSQDVTNTFAMLYHRHGTNLKWLKVSQVECEIRKLSNTTFVFVKISKKI